MRPSPNTSCQKIEGGIVNVSDWGNVVEPDTVLTPDTMTGGVRCA